MPSSPACLHLLVELLGIEPRIWRRVLVPERSSLHALHHAIQGAMGWTDSHLYEFGVGDIRYLPHYAFDGPAGVDEQAAERHEVGVLFDDPSVPVHYLYDFGDSWHHRITLERRVRTPGAGAVPRCTSGESACPLEDSGGPPGHERVLDFLGAADSEAGRATDEDDDFTGWIEGTAGGPYDPRFFDATQANARLAKRFTRQGRLRESEADGELH